MTMGKLVCEVSINGEDQVKALTTAAGVAPTLVKSVPGVGKPFWYWPSIPAGTVIACDFTGAPVATADSAQNAALIAGITVAPEDVLTYAPT